MAFIKHKQFTEIKNAADQGNEKAMMIIQSLMKGDEQGQLDNLVYDYYNIVDNGQANPTIDEGISETEEFGETLPQEDGAVEETPEYENVDISSLLDNELDGILDENEIEDISFGDYLKTKKRDNLRARKNTEYFKVFDSIGRENYIASRGQKYFDKFNTLRGDIERSNRDQSKALDGYMNNVNVMLDDDVELNMDAASGAYDDLTNNEIAMKSFGRHWDEDDNSTMIDILSQLVVKFGKQNVIAALNTLKSDSEAYKDYRINKIDSETGRFQKSLEKLLK